MPISERMTDRSFPIEINANRGLCAVALSVNGEYILSGGRYQNIGRWGVRESHQVETIEVKDVLCLSVSKNGRWVAAGTYSGDVFVWDTGTWAMVFEHKEEGHRTIHGLDFSADSSQLVWASENGTATIWVVNSRQHVKTLRHEGPVIAARFSLRGNRLATATENSVRVWSDDDGQSLCIPISITPRYNNGLVWFRDYLYAVSGNAIQQLDTCTGSIISKWVVPNSDSCSCIALPKHGKFIIYATGRTVTFWDTSTHAQFGRIEHPEDISSMTLSPGNKFLAIGRKDGSIVVENLLTDFFPFSSPHPTLQDASIQITHDSLIAWKHDELEKVEALLTTVIGDSQDSSYDVLAARALARARLKNWDAALSDAEMAIRNQPSVLSYIAKSLAHVGKGERDRAYRICDIAFERFHSTHVTLLLLIKAIIVFMAGECPDAISRMDDLTAAVQGDSTCTTIQAYMYLLMGDEHMDRSEYRSAIPFFERAVVQLRDHPNRVPLIITLMSGWEFNDLHITVRLRFCEALYECNRMKDSSTALLELVNKFGEEISTNEGLAEKVSELRCRCTKKLESNGDSATSDGRPDDAISDYSAAIALASTSQQTLSGLLTKRSKAYMAKGSWEQALADAERIINLSPSSPWGYERRHAALHEMGDYENAVSALEAMLLRMSQSRDPDIRDLRRNYVNPNRTKIKIREAVQAAIHELPRVLISTANGQLCNKSEQAASFESSPAFHKLVSSVTTRIDKDRIERVVSAYYRYAMFSHKCEVNEPLFDDVIQTTVFDLSVSPTHDKLRMFCKIVRDASLQWAWSDTCCINKADHVVLQEALVAMFQWYQGSTLTIVFLCDVLSPSRRGDLVRSIWNTRAWTLQEYHASRVVKFYTKDWTLYLDLDIPNHKLSPEIISEMQEATGVSEDVLMELQPGLNDIWEKLHLASTRQSSFVEDAAYSLLGIFSMSMPVVYGERDRALGRLLAQLLPSSGDTSILAWIGKSGSLNSCLPAHTTVFSHQSPPLFPATMTIIHMDETTTKLASSLDPTLVMNLYRRLHALPVPSFSGRRLTLPCIAFDITPESVTPVTSEFVFRSNTLGAVKIKTSENLSRFDSLVLVHPWIDFLLDRRRIEDVSSNSRVSLHGRSHNNTLPPPAIQTETPPSPVRHITRASTFPLSAASPQTKALELVARLRQPFGALLFAQRRQNANEYGRVATDSMITVKVQKGVSLNMLIENIRTVDVL